jgi:hypothetical protein
VAEAGNIGRKDGSQQCLLTQNVRFGSLADKPARAKIRRCPLFPKSGHSRPRNSQSMRDAPK